MDSIEARFKVALQIDDQQKPALPVLRAGNNVGSLRRIAVGAEVRANTVVASAVAEDLDGDDGGRLFLL